jgi:hypothetical protein
MMINRVVKDMDRRATPWPAHLLQIRDINPCIPFYP